MSESRKQRFARLLEPVHEAATRYCRRLCTTRADAEDLYHDAVLAAWHGLPGLRDERHFKPWLFRIVTNTFRNRERRRKWARWLSFSDDGQEDKPVPPAAVIDPRETLDAQRHLEQAMRPLSAEERALIVLFELEQYTIAEIAAFHGAREGTIKSKLSRARAKMRNALIRRNAANDTVMNSKREVGYALHPNQAASE
ncbi:MAG: RNA polymerase sigma factor SigM [Candidatus Zixiibacteriota bacterium]